VNVQGYLVGFRSGLTPLELVGASEGLRGGEGAVALANAVRDWQRAAAVETWGVDHVVDWLTIMHQATGQENGQPAGQSTDQQPTGQLTGRSTSF
jgi:hypothetical protein